MLPRQGKMGEKTPFTRKCTSKPSETLERVTTSDAQNLKSPCAPDHYNLILKYQDIIKLDIQMTKIFGVHPFQGGSDLVCDSFCARFTDPIVTDV